MSIASELNNYRNGLDDAWDAAEDMGATIPHDRNMNNLDDAIRTIPQSQGATYTAGNGINIDANNEISVDTSVVATKTDLAGKQDTLTAGSNMTISNNVISAKVDSALSASSTNPVQNSVVKAALDGFISEDDLYSEVCGSGTTITFQDAPDNAPLSDFKLKGETSQNGTPTPDAPVAVQTVTGENTLTISDGTNTQSYEVNLGKNLAKMANGAYSYSEAGQTFTLLDGSITTTRTNGSYQGGAINISTGALNRWSKNCASDSHLTGSGGTYTLTFSRTGDVVSSSSPRACIYGFIYDSNGNNTSGNGQLLVDLSSQTSGTYTLNLAADRHLGALVFYSQYISYSDVEFKVQLEKGSTATSYAPYFTPIELCKIGTYQDYIYKSGGKWYVHKETTKVVLNGSENWSIPNTGKVNYWYNLAGAAPGTVGNPDNARWLASNYGKGGQVISSNTTQGIFILSAGSVRIRYGSEMSLADWKAKLGTTNMALYYALATPTDTEITNEALVAQLEAILSQGHTYAGTNNITTVIAAGNAQGELEICYTKTLLPIATETNLGLVQIGSGLSITPKGVLSATGGGAAQNEPIVVWLDWDSVGTDLEVLGTATGQFMDNYTSSATAVGSSFFAGAVSDNKQVIIRTGGGLPVPGRDWARETLHPVQVNYNTTNGATIYFWHETMFVRAQCPNSGTTWTFTKLSV